MITRRGFLRRTGASLAIALSASAWPAKQAAAAQSDPDLSWPMFRRGLPRTGFTPKQGRIQGPQQKWRFGAESDVESSPAVGDVDGDGMPEVVFGDFRGFVYAVDGASSGLTRTPKWRIKAGDLVWSSPALGDVDGDGQVEVAIGSDDRHLYVLDGATGQTKWRFKTLNRVRSSPVIADVDGDGQPEIVVASNQVYALDARRQRRKWVFPLQTSTFSSPSVGDIDGDGRPEVVIGSYDNLVYALDGASGQAKWRFRTDNGIESSPAIGDIDGDGEAEVVFGFGQVTSPGQKGVYALRGRNGQPKWFFQVTDEDGEERIISSPALGDVDNDGETEVVLGTNKGTLYVFSGTGDGQGNAQVKYTHQADNKIESSPSLGDIDGDGQLEIVVGSHDFTLYVLKAIEGRRTLNVDWTFSTAGTGLQPIIFSSPALADIDNDGEIELVVGASNSLVYAFDGR